MQRALAGGMRKCSGIGYSLCPKLFNGAAREYARDIRERTVGVEPCPWNIHDTDVELKKRSLR